MQNYGYVRRFVDLTTMRLSALFTDKAALGKAHVFFDRVQGLQALNFAFQDTFKNCFVFALIGSTFLILILVTEKTTKREVV
ncbi:MAG: hypothetical protein ABIK98_00145 [Pseudomonadota bacterium]|uniref:Uncharacterized protein n=1 Tax=Candidatus Desulfatibia profunda TaxID=2841695 RepID=A0A8J6NS74_9BACT|nr:hypothetical protein [Candidatus Desulfatibia profunda]MBU0697889.1 hypothetical protein [Pseudomonadota bacterium]